MSQCEAHKHSIHYIPPSHIITYEKRSHMQQPDVWTNLICAHLPVCLRGAGVSELQLGDASQWQMSPLDDTHGEKYERALRLIKTSLINEPQPHHVI